MPKKSNGIIWKIVGILITLGVLAVGVIYGYANLGHEVAENCKDIAVIAPEVQKNTEHRLKDEVDTRYIKEKISNIETVQRQILEEVRK